MKLGNTVLLAIATIVAFVYLIVANAAPAYLPPFPKQIFWLVIVAPVILLTIIFAIVQDRSKGLSKTKLSQRWYTAPRNVFLEDQRWN